jgi:hypothetical protein
MVCRADITCDSPAGTLWALLTDAAGYPAWNSTVTAIDGRIREGERIRIHVPGTERTFTPKVSGIIPERHMVWTGGVIPLFLGVRTFTLTPQSDRTTAFIMEERFSGLMLPLVRGAMPDMRLVFARFATDLDQAARLRDLRLRGVATF